jgi:apolipoprotein N-acyltransferase
VFLPAVVSSVLLWAAYFPLNLGSLGFIALVPWLALVRAPVSNKRRYFAAYIGGVVFFALATQWVRVAHPMMYMSWLGLSVVMPVFWLVALAVIRKLDRLGVPLALAVPVAWVALEYCRMHFPTGFPFMKHLGAYQMIGFGWYFLGYTQHEFLAFIQVADIGGVYAVTFVVAAVNGAMTEVTLRLPPVLRALRWSEPVPHACCAKSVSLGNAFAIVLCLANLAYGYARLSHAPFAEGPLVAAIQGNVSQGDKMARGGSLQQSYGRAFKTAYDQSPQPDIIIWPETCYWEDWFAVAPGVSRNTVPQKYERDLADADRHFRVHWKVPILFGLSGHEWDGERMWKFNSALLVRPESRDPVRYDKMHLVPFGEYVPLKDQLPFMAWFTPYKHDYSCRPGEQWTRFPLTAKDGRPFTFGCLICYEDSDPYLARQYVATEPVHFLVNTSNDGWFDGTEEHEQHLAICRFRAIESRRAVVRSVNMGISGVIDSDGRVVALPNAEWSQSKKTEAVVTARVPLDTRTSRYAQLGDWLPAACWLAVFSAIVCGWVCRTCCRSTNTQP